MGKFGWDLPPGCSHADIERHFGEPDISPESEKVCDLLTAGAVEQSLIDAVCEVVDGLADRAYNCPDCAKRRDDAEYELDMELSKAGDAFVKGGFLINNINNMED